MDLLDNNGTGLSYEVEGRDDCPAVLLLHGLSSSLETWRETVDRLKDTYQVWTLDFRGHGDSDRVPGGYVIDGFASDAETILEMIARPTAIVGHSLGGATAAFLAGRSHPLVTGVFLEDPPMFITDPGVWKTAVFAEVFAQAQSVAKEMQERGATQTEYETVAANAPAPGGGVAADKIHPAQVLAVARSMMRLDPAVWDSSLDETLLANMDPRRPISCPVTVVRADPNLGPAFMPGDDEKLRSATPHAEVLLYEGVGHRIHSDKVLSARFLDDVEQFLGLL